MSQYDGTSTDAELAQGVRNGDNLALVEQERRKAERARQEAFLKAEAERQRLATLASRRPRPYEFKVPLDELEGEEIFARILHENFGTVRAWVVWIPVILFFYFFMSKAYIDHHPWPLLIIVGAALINSPASRVILGGLVILGVILYVLFKLFVHVY